ncbi:hypothetical protein J6590_039447 [Homalodisca vitripennis]|nr:hypothetical protein J6590_039447 [Homalodisca vitripennis]
MLRGCISTTNWFAICTVQIAVEWYLDDYVTRIAIRDLRKRHRLAEGLRNPGLLTEADVAAVFLVPMNGGIWTLCVSLTRRLGDGKKLKLQRDVFRDSVNKDVGCIQYLRIVLEVLNTSITWKGKVQNP